LEALHEHVCDDVYLPDELLYGRVGYMYALLFVESQLGLNKVNKDIVLKVCIEQKCRPDTCE